MTFLAPFALLGVLLLALPVVVHLFKPRKVKPTPFSSLRWLKQAHQRLSRRIQWHQWLLFLLRAGFILLLVLALARPLFAPSTAGRPTDRYIILDVGRTMTYAAPGLPSPLERAREVATGLLEHAPSSDRTALLLAGSQVRIVSPLTTDNAAALARLRTVRAEAGDSVASAALPIIRALRGSEAADRDVELVFLTSNRQRGWRPGEIQDFLQHRPAPARVRVIGVGPAAPQNAWIAGARLLERGEADDRLLSVAIGCTGDSKQERGVRLTGITDTSDVQQVTLTPGKTTRVAFKIPAAVPLKGKVAELRLEPADALPGDDQFFLNLDAAWALRLLVVEPEPPRPGMPGTGLHLRTAAEALAAAGDRSLKVVSRSAAGVTVGDFRQADIILLAGVRELSSAAVAALQERVQAGAGLVVFLGPGLNPTFYNEKLYRPLQPAAGLLPAPLKTGADMVKAREPGLLTGVRWFHPLLAPLRDPLLGDLTLCRFRKHAVFAAEPGKGDTVLARIDDDAPALIEHPFGVGRVLIWNTTANDQWSNLPHSRSFVPLLDRTLSYLAARGIRRSFTVGEPITLPLANWRAGSEVVVVTPGEDKRTPRLQAVGGQMFAYLDEVTEPGVYRVERAGKTGDLTFAVNVPREASPLNPMDGKTLEQWWAPVPVEVLGAEEAAELWSAGSVSWPLWPALVLVACLLLLAETVYVYRLCPRLNPRAAESVVPPARVAAAIERQGS